MKPITLHDTHKHLDFAPLSLTRAIGDLRIGILTNKERYEAVSEDLEIGFRTEDYLSSIYSDNNGLPVNACVIPDKALIEEIMQLSEGSALYQGEVWIAGPKEAARREEYSGEIPAVIEERWHIYQKNGAVIESDFELLTSGRTSKQLSPTNTIIGDPNRVFLEEGAKVEGCTLNTTGGLIYVGKNAEIMEGGMLRGPIALCEKAVFKMGAKVYGATTLGPHCKVGGEVNNVVFQAYSNKGHDGFLGNSVIGEWCNLGADSNCSNLKNNYGSVKTYSYRTQHLEPTNVQFMGLIMGDHSRCGINSMFNTATIVGVSANVFGAGFPPKYVPSFAWGAEGDRFAFDKAVESANRMMERRGKKLSADEIAILQHIADTE